VESGQTKWISQRVKRNASSLSPDSYVSFRVSFVMTQYEHHVQEVEDTEDVIEVSEPEGQVQGSIAAHKSKKKYTKAGSIF